MSYGNIKNVTTSGASSSTAEADGLNYSGRSASHTMAEEDFERMKEYIRKIKGAADDSGIDPFVIAAIISRESRAGDGLDDDGWGDDKNAFGLMQVDKRCHNPHPNSEAWDSLRHLCYASGILVGCIGDIRRKFPKWNKEQQLKGGLAAYNMGASRVHSYDQVDANTTGRDYSNDVVARAQWYEKKHSESWCGIF